MNACVHNDSGQPEATAGTTFLAGCGEMGQRMRAHDWGSTPLGSAQSWPQSLQTVVRVMLDCRWCENCHADDTVLCTADPDRSRPGG
jgi:hypothetical protein